jgi:allantoinase
LATRPGFWELRAIMLMCDLCREFRCPVHIVHLAASDMAYSVIGTAREAGLPFTAEACPHYLYFHAKEIPDGDPRFKCAPPIRKFQHREILRGMLYHRWIETIGSDHSPAPPALKHLDDGDLRRAWGGIASLQLLLPVVWTIFTRTSHHRARALEALTTRPAKLVGLSGRKGAIAAGCDADLVLFDADAEFVVTPEMLHHRHKATPYLGHTLRGLVEATYLRGRKVYDRGEVLGGPTGQLLSRPAAFA